MGIDWQPFVDIVRTHESFLLTTHTRPDGDALGSELAMAHALRSLGKEVYIVNADAVPPHIAFIDADREIRCLEHDFAGRELPETQVLLVLDTSASSQLGGMADVVRHTKARKVLIDHHVSDDDLGTENFKDIKAEAAGRLVLEAIEALEVRPTPAMATALFAAIATDTGWFRFASVTDKSFDAARRLVQAGARPATIFAKLYQRNSLARIWLHGHILNDAQTALNGRLIFSSVRRCDFAETGAELTDTEDVVNRLLSVAGVEVAILFVEIESGMIKASLRSRSQVDVRQVAEEFSGGGHTAAAGLRYLGDLEAARAAVLDAVRKVMK